jgi:hypothetical protein
MNIAFLTGRHRAALNPLKIQSKDGGSGSGSTSATSSAVGYASTTTAGSLLVLVAWAQGSSGGTASLGGLTVSTPGFTWTLAGTVQTFSASSGHFAGALGVYYITGASAMATTTHTTVSVTGAGNVSTEVEFSLYEFGPCNGALDTTQSGSGSSSAPSTTNLATSFRDLIFVAFYAQNGSSPSTAGSGYTLGVSATSITVGQAQYALAVNAGSIATAFVGNQLPWVCVSAAFKI